MHNISITYLCPSASRKSGGIFYSSRSLAAHVALNNFNVKTFAGRDQYSDADKVLWNENTNLTFLKVKGIPAFGYQPDLIGRLESSRTNILHLHGIWMYPGYAALRWKLENRGKLMVSPRGMLDKWALDQSKLKKYIVKKLFVNKLLDSTDCIHALNEMEYESIRSIGLKNPIAIIPNGIEIKGNINKKINNNTKKIIFIGRLHPKKNIENLILAIKNISMKDIFTPWELHLAGWGSADYIMRLQEIIRHNRLDNKVFFVGPKYGVEKEEFLKDSDLFILPSFSEGLPIAVLEAWASKIPVLMTENCNIPSAFSQNCAIKVGHDPIEIANCIENFIKKEKISIDLMVLNAYKKAELEYNWKKISDDMCSVYKWLQDGEFKPDCVRLK